MTQKRSSNERFELINRLYQADTGYMRPGKSDPNYDTSCDENRERFEHWLATKAWFFILDTLIEVFEKIEELKNEIEHLENCVWSPGNK